jgi:hypothetical protein
MKREEGTEWKEAMNKEMESLMNIKHGLSSIYLKTSKPSQEDGY